MSSRVFSMRTRSSRTRDSCSSKETFSLGVERRASEHASMTTTGQANSPAHCSERTQCNSARGLLRHKG